MRDGPHTRHNLHPKAAGPLTLVLRVPRDNVLLEAYAGRGNLRVPPVQQLLPQAPTQRLLLMYHLLISATVRSLRQAERTLSALCMRAGIPLTIPPPRLCWSCL